MYVLTRNRFRTPENDNDRGPEGWCWRYEISLGVFKSEEECFEKVSRIEGKTFEDVRYEFSHRGFFATYMKPTFHRTSLVYHKITGEIVDDIKYTSYWDEYYIYRKEG